MLIFRKEKIVCIISTRTCVDLVTGKEVIYELNYAIYDDNDYVYNEDCFYHEKKFIISDVFFNNVIETGALEVSQAIKNSDDINITEYLSNIVHGGFQLKTFIEVIYEIVRMLKKYDVKETWFPTPFLTKTAFIETASLVGGIYKGDIETIFKKCPAFDNYAIKRK